MILLISLLLAAPAKQTGKAKIAVMDLQPGAGVTADMAQTMTSQLALGIDALGPFKSMTMRDVRQMLAQEATKQTLGCSANSECIAELASAMGSDYSISGSVVMFGPSYLIQLQLLNVKRARVEQRVSREYQGGVLGLFDELKTAAKIALRDLLAARSGELVVRVSEEGATVRVDGSIVGVSPLPRLQLSGGVHTIGVEKSGFIVEMRDIEIKERVPASLEIALRPSDEYKRAFRQAAMRQRIGAIITTGLGIAAIAVGVAIFVLDYGTARKLSEDVTGFNDLDRRPPLAEDQLNNRLHQLGTLDGVALGLGIGGAVATVIGVVLLATGDNPSKYETYLRVSHKSVGFGWSF